MIKRIETLLFLLIISPPLLSQNSLRKFNEINPALESARTSNLVYRNIFTQDAIYQYFHIHNNRFTPRINIGFDIQTRSYDLLLNNSVSGILKGQFQKSITRKKSLIAGIAIGLEKKKKISSMSITPGIGFYGEKFIIGYCSKIFSLTEISHSVQFEYRVNNIGKRYISSYNTYSNLHINLIYLNYWQRNDYFKQFYNLQLCAQNINLLAGIQTSNKKELNPVFGFGWKGNNLNFNFQTTISKNEITEMQITLKYFLPNMTIFGKRGFRSFSLAEI